MDQAALTRLRQLLLDEEQQQIAELQRQLAAGEDLRGRLPDWLPAALTAAAKRGDALGLALQKPVRDGVAQAVREDAEGFAEVLFPVMGPGIRRAIAEALRDFSRSLNHSLGRGVVWRIEALRRGVPFAEVVLERTMAYRVELALLIQPETGLVISRAESRAVVARDSDAFSAMLTAIQDFIRDSFAGDSQISTLELGDRTVWITAGQHAHLACVISGIPGQPLRRRLADTVDMLHAQHRNLLAEFSGDRTGLDPVDAAVARCLEPDQTEREVAAASASHRPLLILVLLLGVLGWLLWPGRSATPALQAPALLDAAPGVVIHRVERGAVTTLRGLRDPLADEPATLLAAAGIQEGKLQFALRPYLSLEPAIILRRARQMLDLPDGIDMELRGDVLHLRGRADPAWLAARLRHPPLIPGVRQLDTAELRAGYTADWLRRQLALPAGAELEWREPQLRLRGSAPLAWLRGLPERLRQLPGLALAAEQTIEPSEWRQALALARELSRQALYFDGGASLTPASLGDLGQLQAGLNQLQQLQGLLGFQTTLRLRSFTDGVGEAELNRALRQQRIDTARRLLLAAEPWPELALDPQPDYQAQPGIDPVLRRVDLQLSLTPPASWL